MKLLFCPECQDIFKLKVGEMRFCECGHVYGKYADNGRDAYVSESGVSIAIGNGSLREAIFGMMALQAKSKNSADRKSYQTGGKIEYAWVRPNEGEGNPHCKVIYDPHEASE